MVNNWTPEQIEYLKEIVPGTPFKEVTDKFNSHFGLALSNSAVRAKCKKEGIKNGRDTKIKPGSTPYNKGKKMPPEVYEKCKGTMYKKGNIPHNTLPIGTEMNLDGYIYIKVNDDPKVHKNKNWKQKHRLVWEAANGPIPEGYVLTFLDGNQENCNLENLELVTKGQITKMNQYGLYSSDPKLTEAGLTYTKLKMAISKRKKEKRK